MKCDKSKLRWALWQSSWHSSKTEYERTQNISLIIFLLFIYSHVLTLFGSFLLPAPLCHPLPFSPSLPGRTCSALISNFGEEKT
jgi:hypothetical protein